MRQGRTAMWDVAQILRAAGLIADSVVESSIYSP
jgi:hypothetical protein